MDTIPEATIRVIHNLRHFIAERARTTRRFIKKTRPPYRIEELTVHEMQKNNHADDVLTMMAWLNQGQNVGVISEAGVPGMADPGALFAAAAHQAGYSVQALSGPSSVVLALSASGLNGQNFCFHGYLPIKTPELKITVKKLGDITQRTGQTQIFIETPYRNDRLLKMLRDTLPGHLMLSISVDLTGALSRTKTMKIKDWAAQSVELGKQPAIFLIGISV